jgi:hypothetical protein
MGNAWESAKGLAEKHASSGGVFVRLATSGDKVTGVFCGEPYAREVIWTGERYEPYDANNPAHQAEAKRPSLRVALNFFVIAEGVMKLIEGGTQWFKDVLKVRDKELLRELGVQRVRDLKVSDIGRTRALLARYEQSGGDVHTGDIDPFA